MEAVLFYFFSAVSIISGLMVILVSQPTRSLLSLVITMVALACLYILLGAHFIAIAQIIVYAGAVLILFLFVIMLQGVGARDVPLLQRFNPVLTALMTLSALSFLGVLVTELAKTAPLPLKGVEGTVQAVGLVLFTEFLLPFELTAIILLLSVFAAAALARKEET